MIDGRIRLRGVIVTHDPGDLELLAVRYPNATALSQFEVVRNSSQPPSRSGFPVSPTLMWPGKATTFHRK